MVTVLLLKFCMLIGIVQALIPPPFDHRILSAPPSYLVAYQEWPAGIPCSAALEVGENDFLGGESENLSEDNEEMSGESGDDVEPEEYQCIIEDESGSIVLNRTTTALDTIEYITPDMPKRSSMNYKLYITNWNIERYILLDFQIQLRNSRESNCQKVEHPKVEYRSRDVRSNPYSLSCQSDYSNRNISSEMKWRWFYSCSSQLPANTETRINPTGGSELVFDKLSSDNSGEYTCAQTYNGKTRFFRKYSLCVTDPDLREQPSLKCETGSLKTNEGDTAKLSCTAGFGQAIPSQIRIRLFKANSYSPILCRPIDQQELDSRKDKRIICLYKASTQRDGCPPQSDSKSISTFVQLFITINDVNKGDWGTYLINSEGVIWSGIQKSTNASFTLEPDLVSELNHFAAVIAICITSLLLCCIAMTFLFRNIVFIRVYHKRYFGAYVVENKEHGAMFIYNFSEDLDKFSRDHVRSSVSVVREVLESQGHSVYDENKDGGMTAFRAESFSRAMKISHRIVIFLNADFIKDDWNMLALQKGFQEMINSSSRLIFILLPGIKEYLKQHSKDDDSCRLIQRAIKLNYAIHFPINLKRFRYLLEDAMPKIPPPLADVIKALPTPLSEISSITSSLDCDIAKHHNYQRCYSNDTNVTVVDISDDEAETIQIPEQQCSPQLV